MVQIVPGLLLYLSWSDPSSLGPYFQQKPTITKPPASAEGMLSAII